MKTSNYIIYLHIPETDEYYLVHGYSGAVDKVTPEVVKYLLDRTDPNFSLHINDQELAKESLRGRMLGDISSESIELLVTRGYLTSMSTQEERGYVERLAGFLHKKSLATKRPGFMIVPTYECNLRCPYCFESDARVQLSKLSVLKNVMLEGMVDAAFKSMDIISKQRIPNYEDIAGKLNHSITLYGGEPLMKDTLPIVNYIVQQGIEKGYVFSAITNGVDLPNFIHLLGSDKICMLQITLDGPKDIHDRKRIGPLHRNGTYDRILENVKLALESSNVKISMRLHMDWQSAERSNEVIEDLEQKGLFEHKNFGIYAYPVHNYHQGFEEPVHPFMAIHEVQKLFDKSSSASDKSVKIKRPDGAIPYRLKQYVERQLLGLYKVIEPCAATTGMYIFDPIGRIYTCWDTVGAAGLEVGTYSADGPALNSLAEDWLRRSPQYIQECKDCKYILLHFAGCASLPLNTRKTIFSPSCYQFQDDFVYIGQKFFQLGSWDKGNKQDASAKPQQGLSGPEPSLENAAQY